MQIDFFKKNLLNYTFKMGFLNILNVKFKIFIMLIIVILFYLLSIH